MTQAPDRTLGQIDMEARFDFLRLRHRTNNEDDLRAANEAGALAVRDAVMAHVINKIKLYAMTHAKPGTPAMQYSHELIEYLRPVSSEVPA